MKMINSKKIPFTTYDNIMKEAFTMSEDLYLGLHIGEHSELGDLSTLGYIMANCNNLREALEKACEYFGLITNFIHLYLWKSGYKSRFVFQVTRRRLNPSTRQIIDVFISSFIKLINNITRNPVELQALNLHYEKPGAEIKEYTRIFSCPVQFNSPVTTFIFETGYLEMPIIHPNHELLALLEQHAIIFLDKAKDNSRLLMKTKNLLFEKIQNGSPCIKTVASELGMSVRCFQLRLSKEGITFSQLVKNIRRELAENYLAEKRYSIDDITYLLGFSEPSVFHRAFKSWTGITPGQYRMFQDPVPLNKNNYL
jgi:AraC-like DNA-binding protein